MTFPAFHARLGRTGAALAAALLVIAPSVALAQAPKAASSGWWIAMNSTRGYECALWPLGHRVAPVVSTTSIVMPRESQRYTTENRRA